MANLNMSGLDTVPGLHEDWFHWQLSLISSIRFTSRKPNIGIKIAAAAAAAPATAGFRVPFICQFNLAHCYMFTFANLIWQKSSSPEK
jgi:hypothetical protein